jgi:hypothetical protein
MDDDLSPRLLRAVVNEPVPVHSDDALSGPGHTPPGPSGRARGTWRALAIALLVVIAGAAAGAAGYLTEQSRAHWRPHLSRTVAGWRIDPPHALGFTSVALTGRYLIEQADPYTVLIDLTTGTSKLLGSAQDSSSASAPLLSDRYVVWLEQDVNYDASAVEFVLYVYDLQSHRRTANPESDAPTCLLGTNAIWMTTYAVADRPPAIVAEDLSTGRRFSFGTWWATGQDPAFDGTTVAAVRAKKSGWGATIRAQDVVTGRRWLITHPPPPALRSHAPGPGSSI